MDEHNMKVIQWIGGIIIGVFLLLMGVGRVIQAKNLENRIVQVEATVNSVDLIGKKADGDMYFLNLSYVYNGQKCAGTMSTRT